MVEIHSYDITTHEQFARNQQEVEAFRKQYRLPLGGATVAAQTRVLDFVPKHPALVLLMQTYQRKMWASFVIPKNYYLQRFASSYVAPSLGPREKQEADIARLEAFLKKKIRGQVLSRKQFREELDQEEEEEHESGQKQRQEKKMVKEAYLLMELLDEGIKETNAMIDEVIARLYQFVQA